MAAARANNAPTSSSTSFSSSSSWSRGGRQIASSSSPPPPPPGKVQFPFSPIQSKNYAEVLEKAIFAHWSKKFIESVPMPLGGEKVLDVACGTGATSREIARALSDEDRFSKVVGIDSSEGMLEEAKRREAAVEEAKRGKNKKNANENVELPAPIEYQMIPIEEFTDREEQFDRAYCHQGAQFFTDREKALGNVFKSLKPGAHFNVAVWAPVKGQKLFEVLRDCLIECQKEEWVPILLKPFSYAGDHESTSRVDAIDRLETDLIKAGFENVDVIFESDKARFDSLDEALKVISVAPFGKELMDDAKLFEKFTRKFKTKMLTEGSEINDRERANDDLSQRLKSGTDGGDEVVVTMMSFFAHCNKPWAAGGIQSSSFKC
jgi:ubiquinone/menaquinone biosynthesis C-methylase UbiE